MQSPPGHSPLPCVELNPDFNHHLDCNGPSTATAPLHLQVKTEPITTTVELARRLLLCATAFNIPGVFRGNLESICVVQGRQELYLVRGLCFLSEKGCHRIQKQLQQFDISIYSISDATSNSEHPSVPTKPEQHVIRLSSLAVQMSSEARSAVGSVCVILANPPMAA
eukprot:6075076-Pyramimonas_sp.AAC.1